MTPQERLDQQKRANDAANGGVATPPTTPAPTQRKLATGGQSPNVTQTQATQSNSLVDSFKSGLSNLPYYNTPAFQQLVSNFTSDPGRTLRDEGNSKNWQSIFQGYANTFQQYFKDKVGIDPTPADYNTFFEQVVNTDQPWNKTPDQAQIQQQTAGLISNAFSSRQAEEAQKKAEGQVGTALAPGSAFDQWQNSYRNSVSETEKALGDYQTRLFEKLRPQLLTSLQSQGLLNTGALNEAFAGAAKDLTDTNTNYIAGARNAAETDIANRKYDIQASPGNFGLQNTFASTPNLMASGQNALQNVWNDYSQGNLIDRQYQNQMNLMNAQRNNQPSALSQYGGLILGGMAGGLPGAFASYASSRANARAK